MTSGSKNKPLKKVIHFLPNYFFAQKYVLPKYFFHQKILNFGMNLTPWGPFHTCLLPLYFYFASQYFVLLSTISKLLLSLNHTNCIVLAIPPEPTLKDYDPTRFNQVLEMSRDVRHALIHFWIIIMSINDLENTML